MLLGGATTARALEPRQIVLVVNRNTPEGRELAQHYAAQRSIPPEHILDLDLPRGEEIAFADYETKVVPPLREMLIKQRLHAQATCVVTFFGVPTKIAARINSEADEAELKQLRAQLTEVEQQLRPLVDELEALARTVDPGFVAPRGQGLELLARRTEHAAQFIAQKAPLLADEAKREQVKQRLATLGQRFAEPAKAAAAQAAASGAATEPADGAEAILNSPQWRRQDPAGRAALRNAAAGKIGVLDFGRLLEAQVGYLSPADTHAAFDNELALLWWNLYPRQRWQPNPLHWRLGGMRTSPVLMVMRLDGPDAGVVRRIIDDSILVEQQGLTGRVLIDLWDKPLRVQGKEDAYGKYDQGLRDLATLLRDKTKLEVILDETPDVVGPHATDKVAIYCGWYSSLQYVPPAAFNTGAVGYHIASFTMVALRTPRGGDWVRSLLVDGLAATLGPVAEPYLHSFPPADEFFPLLLTGRLTLAEVYWKTNPLTSWQMTMIGDPLYTPFKVNPPLKAEDLPEPLRAALDKR